MSSPAACKAYYLAHKGLPYAEKVRKPRNLRCPASATCALADCPHKRLHYSKGELDCKTTPCTYKAHGATVAPTCHLETPETALEGTRTPGLALPYPNTPEA